MRRIEDVAMDRAMHGVETPVYSYGKLVGTRRAAATREAHDTFLRLREEDEKNGYCPFDDEDEAEDDGGE